MQKMKERAVLVTTAHKGVFFGYAKETMGSTIKRAELSETHREIARAGIRAVLGVLHEN